MHNFAAFSLVGSWDFATRRGCGFLYAVVHFCTLPPSAAFIALPPPASFQIHGCGSRFCLPAALHAPASDSLLPDVTLRCRAQLTSWDFVDRCSFARDISSHSPVSTGPLCLCKVRARWNILGANSSNSYTKSINMGRSMRVTV